MRLAYTAVCVIMGLVWVAGGLHEAVFTKPRMLNHGKENMIDLGLANGSVIAKPLLERYCTEDAEQLIIDRERIEAPGITETSGAEEGQPTQADRRRCIINQQSRSPK